ncbi:MAG: hypothetical protein Q7T53_04440 [Deltaproteobacteria bacterium]|nr:hypothetical protein [Deltaproteobacteria bacterium]
MRLLQKSESTLQQACPEKTSRSFDKLRTNGWFIEELRVNGGRIDD